MARHIVTFEARDDWSCDVISRYGLVERYPLDCMGTFAACICRTLVVFWQSRPFLVDRIALHRTRLFPSARQFAPPNAGAFGNFAFQERNRVQRRPNLS